MLYKLTHARAIRRTSVIALIGSITILLNLDRATGLQQIVHKLAVVAFAPDNGPKLGLVHDFLIVRAFDGIESTLEGLDARPAGFLEQVPLQSPPNRLADVLRLVSPYIVSAARLAMIVGDGNQAKLSQTKGFVNRIKSLRAFPTFGYISRLLPLLRFTHALKTPESSPERRIVERASELKRLFEETILLIVHTKRKVDNEGRVLGAHKIILLPETKVCAPFSLIEVRGLRRTGSIKPADLGHATEYPQHS